jgi:hypothetical protein
LTFEEGTTLKLYSHKSHTEAEQQILDVLRDKLDVAISEAMEESPEKKAFVKLSFMSPKDVSLRISNTHTKSNFRERLQEILSQDPNAKNLLRSILTSPPSSQEERIFAVQLYRTWLTALYASLSVTSGQDAISNICMSSRCCEELNEAVMLPEHPELFRTCAVVRPWIKIRPGFEFRIFVSNGKITCAGQYEPVYYPEVWDMRQRLEEEIREFVNTKVIPRVNHRLPSLVVDIVMTEDEKFYVCEINPFAASTSGCMFRWDADKVTMMIGPETWRFPGPGEGTVPELPSAWKKWVEEEWVEEEGGQWLRWVGVAVVMVGLAVGVNYWYTRNTNIVNV